MIKEFFQPNKKIIINTDIDGLLSGLLLHHTLGCEVVGFSNSWDKVWIDRSRVDSIFDAVYVDLFVADPNVKCVEQHVIAANEDHLEALRENPNKVNPNLDRGRYFCDSNSYKFKYPFATFHYICALLEGEGCDIDIDMHSPAGQFTIGDFIMRADTAIENTKLYGTNARQWWPWLKNLSGDGKMMNRIIDYIDEGNHLEESTDVKNKIDAFCKGAPYYAKQNDGEYKEILDEYGDIKDGFIRLVQFLAESTGLACFNMDLTLETHSAEARRIVFYQSKIDEFVMQGTYNGNRLFSYGFIYGPRFQYGNFSYTLEME